MSRRYSTNQFSLRLAQLGEAEPYTEEKRHELERMKVEGLRKPFSFRSNRRIVLENLLWKSYPSEYKRWKKTSHGWERQVKLSPGGRGFAHIPRDGFLSLELVDTTTLADAGRQALRTRVRGSR